MPIEEELAELERRIARMRALLRGVSDERAIKAIQDTIEEANRRLELLSRRDGKA